VAHLDRIKEGWIKMFKHILIDIQLRDKLEKTLVIRDNKGGLRKILIGKTLNVESL